MSYKLFYIPGSAAMAPHAILREIGAAAEFVRLDREKNEHKASEYLTLNPHGRVPTFTGGVDDAEREHEHGGTRGQRHRDADTELVRDPAGDGGGH